MEKTYDNVIERLVLLRERFKEKNRLQEAEGVNEAIKTLNDGAESGKLTYEAIKEWLFWIYVSFIGEGKPLAAEGVTWALEELEACFEGGEGLGKLELVYRPPSRALLEKLDKEKKKALEAWGEMLLRVEEAKQNQPTEEALNSRNAPPPPQEEKKDDSPGFRP